MWVWLTAQKLTNRLGGWKGKFALFQMPATGGEGGPLSKGWLPQLPTSNQWGKNFYRQKEGDRCRNSTAQSALTVIFKLIIGGLTSVILIVLGTVNLQFQGPFVPMSLRSILEIVAAHIWVQPGHHGVNFTWCFSICKTADRIWLKILSIALGKELKVPDCA